MSMPSQLRDGTGTHGTAMTRGVTLGLAALGFVLGLVSGPIAAPCAVIRVAVASNFAGTAKALARTFEASSEHQVVLVPGSTGKHFAQIINGAPIDILFAADALRPTLLEERGIGIPGSRFTYAVGRLVLWSPRKGWFDSGKQILEEGDFRRLAIANPKLAPYGQAARQTLEVLKLWSSIQSKIVRGENVGQTFHFVVSGNSELGFVALSQIISIHPDLQEGSHWIVPENYYNPIEQQALLLVDTPPSQSLVDFVQSDPGRSIIRRFGYRTP
jgi:molybdate transport system substrate-binding protein